MHRAMKKLYPWWVWAISALIGGAGIYLIAKCGYDAIGYTCYIIAFPIAWLPVIRLLLGRDD